VKGITGTPGSNKGKLLIKRDVFVFAFFLLLSFVFWYLNSLDKEVETGIRYNVKYTNIPRGRSVVEKESEKLNLYLKGTGSSVLRQKLARKAPLTIDISKVNYKRVPGSSELDYYIVTAGLSRSFSVQLRSEFEIMSVKPDTLYFSLQKAATPEQPVEENKALFRKNKPEQKG
jgi:hypothetical protein